MENQITEEKTYTLDEAIALLDKYKEVNKQCDELVEKADEYKNPPEEVENPHRFSQLANAVIKCLIFIAIAVFLVFTTFSDWSAVLGLIFILIGVGGWAYMYFIPLIYRLKDDEDVYKQYCQDYAAWQERGRIYLRKLDEVSDAIPSVEDMSGVLFDSINRQLLLPFNVDWITEDNIVALVYDVDYMLSLKKEVQEETDVKKRKSLLVDLSDEKVEFLYNFSIKEESDGNEDAYSPFDEKLSLAWDKEDDSLLRKDREENKILSNKKTKVEVDVQKCKDLLVDNKMEPLLAQLEETKNIDTSVMGLGLFTSTDKLAAKTKTLQQLCNAAKAEYDELAEINEKLNNILAYTRLVAYRNIFLCVDLVNFLRANAGGNKLTTQKDSASIEEVQINKIAVNSKNIDMDYGANVGNTVGNIVNRMMDSKSLRKFAKANPAVAAGTAAIEVAQNLLKERSETIEKNNRMQAELIKNIEQMVNSYNEGKAEMMRAIEIIKAITKANKGVVKIYAPLRDKYFTKEEVNVPSMEMMKDLQTLAKATQEYKHISDSKL